MAKPFVESEAIASIGDIPRYPDARIDPPGSKAARGLAMSWRRTIPADRHGVLALRSVEPVEKIADWYGTQMGKLGFQRREGEILKQSGLKRQMSWRRGKAMAMVQIKQDRKEDGVDTRIVLMRLDGLKDR